MKTVHHLLAATALVCISAASQAAAVFNSSAAFLANVSAGAYFENFDSYAGGPTPAGPIAFSGGAFSYSASAPTDLYLFDGTLATSQEDESLTINFAGGNVTAIGANFFATDINPDFASVLMTITLSDGTVETFTPTSASDSFRGFISAVAITSLVLGGPGTSLYATIDNLTVGTAAVSVPEPASLALAGLALAGLFASRRRKD